MKKTGITLITTIKIVVIIMVVAALGYFFGFSTLFAHSMFEIFYYAALFSGSILVVTGIEYLMNKISENVEITA